MDYSLIGWVGAGILNHKHDIFVKQVSSSARAFYFVTSGKINYKEIEKKMIKKIN